MKNLKRITAVLILVALVLALVPNKGYAARESSASVTYKTLSEQESLPTKYSYGTIFWSDKTTVTDIGSTVDDAFKLKVVNEEDDEDTRTHGGYTIKAKAGQKIKLKITNCAIDEDGDICDVVIEANDIEKIGTAGQEESDFDIALNLMKKYDIFYKEIGQFHTFNTRFMNIRLQTYASSVKLNISYYKNGTSTAANINGVAPTIYDIDNKLNSDPNAETDVLFQGNEGVRGLYNSTIYYDNASPMLNKIDGGVAIKADDVEHTIDDEHREGINPDFTCMLAQNEKAKYGIEYAGEGQGVGIYVVFATVIPFTPSDPVKSVDVKKVKVGDRFHYTATQYIPNNYNLGSMEIDAEEEDFDSRESIVTAQFYDNVLFKDVLDDDLKVDETDTDKITITDYRGEDITSWFTIAVDGNTVTAKAKEEVLKNENFYANNINIVIPVKVKEGCTKDEIPNRISTNFTIKGEVITKLSNEVIVELDNKYIVTLDVEVVNGGVDKKESVEVEPGANNTFTVTIKPDDGYELESLVVDGKSVDVTKVTYDKEGKYVFEISDTDINQNIDHVVRAVCKKKPAIIPQTGEVAIFSGAIILVTAGAVISRKKLKMKR